MKDRDGPYAGIGMIRRVLMVFGVLAVIASVSCGSGSADDAPPIRVLVAASVGDAMSNIAASYRIRGGAIEISAAASGTLAVQVRRGIPADVVMFAGHRPMDELDRAGFLESDTRVDLLSNSLVIIVRDTYEGNMTNLTELAEATVRRIAIADPDLAPAGEYALAAIQSAGVLDQVEGRLARSLDVRAATASVSLGTADAGIVYATDVIGVDRIRVAAAIPQSAYPEILYPVAVLKGARDLDGAQRFIAFLKSEAALEIFTRHGFSQPAAAR